MADRDTGSPPPLRVWRRSTERPAVAPAEEKVLCCGGPDRTVDEIFLEMRERKRQWDEERERQKAEEEAAERTPAKRRDDEDDSAALERFRNDRYAVGLLRQDNTAWGDGPTYSGTLG